jgi:CRP/FNR family cyclic AMP-dependent transcriptional regulator
MVPTANNSLSSGSDGAFASGQGSCLGPTGRRRGLSRDPLLAAVAVSLGGEALSDVRTRLVRRGDVLAAPGVPATTVYAVLSGRVGIFQIPQLAPTTGYPAQPRLREVLGPGQRACEADVLVGTNQPTGTTVRCLTSGVVAVISAASLRRWCTDPDVGVLVMASLAQDTLTLERRRARWGQLDVAARLAALLLELYERYGSARSDGGRTVAVVPHGLSQAHLGDLVGARRETVNRVMRALEAEGLLKIGGRGISLYDVPGLAAKAGRGPEGEATDRRAVS